MLRYMAFVWDPRNRSQSGTAQFLSRRLLLSSGGWRNTFDTEGLVIFAAGANPPHFEPCLLSQHRGLVLGTLFSHVPHGDSARRIGRLGPTDSTAIIDSGGRWLVEHCWGRYVAFLHDAAACRTLVVRDPTCALPCLTATIGDVQLYFSYVQDCEVLGLLNFSVNWRFLAAHLAAPFTSGYETGLNEVREVIGGEAIDISRGGTLRRRLWFPTQIAERSGTGVLEAMARQCTHAWASCHGSILCQSDTDSHAPLLLELLRAAPSHPMVRCHAGFAHTSLETLLEAQRTESPPGWLGSLRAVEAELLAASESHADAVFSVGDIDSLLLPTRRVGPPRALLDPATYGELDRQTPMLHPWFSAVELRSHGAYGRVQTLLSALRACSLLARSVHLNVVAPLISQPVIEAVLHGGVPPSAHFEGRGCASELLRQNAALVRNFLLDGTLVREQLLIRARLESILADAVAKRPVSECVAAEILDHFITEAWVASWLESYVRRPRERRLGLVL